MSATKTETECLYSVVAGAPPCLNRTVLPAMLNGFPVQSLLDTGASDRFVNETVVKAVQ